ncbi:hypothetical protein M0812_26057 [Anaeramoeba flamelloides]|uniref:Transforming acidic coiled-coil-containing protein C-terminal domain-containing protein n=1 Tax=Anaeramoeba flamelloides TaxID=1746091 RepID=A0AAV7YCI9_9EUKA|nr:hypothetical protein M0812_26057 [Anaeramoeba flamelloides]
MSHRVKFQTLQPKKKKQSKLTNPSSSSDNNSEEETFDFDLSEFNALLTTTGKQRKKKKKKKNKNKNKKNSNVNKKNKENENKKNKQTDPNKEFQVFVEIDQDTEISLLQQELEQIKKFLLKENTEIQTLTDLVNKYSKFSKNIKIDSQKNDNNEGEGTKDLNKQNIKLKNQIKNAEENFQKLNKRYRRLWKEHNESLQKESELQQSLKEMVTKLENNEERFSNLKDYAMRMIENANIRVVDQQKKLQMQNSKLKKKIFLISTKLERETTKEKILQEEIDLKTNENANLIQVFEELANTEENY